VNASTPAPRSAKAALASRQRGAIGIFGTLTLFSALLFVMLSVDAGRLWFQQRQLQKVADMAAIEAAASLGCAADIGRALSAAQAAADRNNYKGNLGVAPNLVQLGTLRTVNGLHQFTPAVSAEAVHVHATREVETSLVLGGLFGNTIWLHADATARNEPSQAVFSAGSYLLRLDTKNSALLNALLGTLLGSSISLDVASYKGLAAADITLLQLLKVNANVATVDELLNADLTLGDLIGMTRDAVSQQGPVGVVVSALDQLLMGTVNALDVRLGDILAVTSPVSNAAANLNINVLDLITAAAMIANKNHALSVPLSINLGGLINIGAGIDIIEAPQIAMGPAGKDEKGNWCTQASTAQIRINAKVKVNLILADIDLGLFVEVAQGEAHLIDLDVKPGSAHTVIGATPGIASIRLRNSEDTGPASVSLTLLIIRIPVAEIGINLPIQPPSPTDLTYDVNAPVADNLPVTQSVSSSLGASLANALASPDALDIKLLGISLDILDPVINLLLSPLLGLIGSLVDVVLQLLGLQLGGLDITVRDIRYGPGGQLVI